MITSMRRADQDQWETRRQRQSPAAKEGDRPKEVDQMMDNSREKSRTTTSTTNTRQK